MSGVLVRVLAPQSPHVVPPFPLRFRRLHLDFARPDFPLTKRPVVSVFRIPWLRKIRLSTSVLLLPLPAPMTIVLNMFFLISYVLLLIQRAFLFTCFHLCVLSSLRTFIFTCFHLCVLSSLRTFIFAYFNREQED